ncbi:hypothetical protein GW17_00049045 [Ensete ventricosum]|nr:hypothetical protein GW17_00049045 [Ensete ventricosum]
MDRPLLGSLLRSRRLESCLEAKEEHKEAAGEGRRRVGERRLLPDDDGDDGGVGGHHAPAAAVALPEDPPGQPFFQMWILGNPIKIEGSEFSTTRAIYICNHASPIDVFLVMWLTPTGTVGVAKSEVGVVATYQNSHRD